MIFCHNLKYIKMKKATFSPLLLFVIFISFVSASKPDVKLCFNFPQPSELISPGTSDTDGLSGRRADTTYFDFSGLDSTGFELITFEEASSLYNKYKNNFKKKIERNWVSINGSMPQRGGQTRSFWIDIKKLKNFIGALDQLQMKNQQQTISGIRVYFGAYPKKIEAKKKNMMTTIFCGTYDSACYHWDIAESPAKGIARRMLGYANHNHLCPPETICKGALLEQE